MKHPPYWMIWGCLKSNNIGPLVFIDGNVNASKYKEILSNNLLRFYEENNILRDDSASSHRAKVFKDFLSQNNVKTLDWPSNSPDLDPIEHVWAYISRILKKRVIA